MRRAVPPGLTEALATTRPPYPLRVHQHEALEALEKAFASGRRRAWLVLPPGAGKTLVGLEAARRLGQPAVVFGPNTAIQGQWVREWRGFTPRTASVGTDRSLRTPVTALTYQSLAVFDPDAEVDEEGHLRLGAGRRARLLDRLHENGVALVEALRAAGPVTVLLDECHHLLEVWGRLLAELLDQLPEASVVGLTATPPDALTAAEAALVRRLFGAPVYGTGIPAVVREGHLAPFAEFAYLVTPTAAEREWLAAEAERFAELRTDLLDPGFATTSFLGWLDARFVDRRAENGQVRVSWARLEKEEPHLAGAALRLCQVGLLGLPDGARLREEHRHQPTAEDWVALLGDYLKGFLLRSPEDRDRRAVQAVRRALPAVGYSLTKRGIRAGRSPVDRVLARSEAKTHAAVEIVAAEAANLGARLRALVLCDHEVATATLPARLVGVLDEQAGSARLVLERLLADGRTSHLGPMLVTGRTVAAGPQTARDFLAYCARAAPRLSLDVVPSYADGVVEVTGRWRSRTWVRLVTDFFESGGAQALVGTRALLGEGWDARSVNTLVDLTTATTATAVVQTRGRALRIDPEWPEKVANNWTVVCMTEHHPKGDADWDRFVRKHTGYFSVNQSGEVASGVAHVDAGFSPYAPPPVADVDRINAAMLARAESRERVRELWRVGEPYRDRLQYTLRATPTRPHAVLGTPDGSLEAPRLDGSPEPPTIVPAATGVSLVPDGGSGPPRMRWMPAVGLAAGAPAWALAVGAGAAAAGLPTLLLTMLTMLAFALGVVGAWVLYGVATAYRAGRLLREVPAEPDLVAMAGAVADALHDAGMSGADARAVRAGVDDRGVYRVVLTGVAEEESERFAESLDEVLSPMAFPRYVVPRYVADPPRSQWQTLRMGRAWRAGRAPANRVVYHAVPTLLGVNQERVRIFARAWNRWVSDGDPVYTATPEGEGILVTHRGRDPFDATTALRVVWS